MLLRAAILVLLVLNLGVAAWWWAGGPAPAGAAVPAEDAGPRLRLASEAAPRAPAPPAAVPPEVAQAGLAGAPPPQARCVRIGPFADAAGRDAARSFLDPQAERVLPRQAPARATRGWRVILPPLASRAEATAAAERIRAAGVTDLYVLNEGADANAIALGRYGNEEAARRREADLRARGFAAQAQPLGGGPAQWWLDARLRLGADAGALAERVALRDVDCATLR